MTSFMTSSIEKVFLSRMSMTFNSELHVLRFYPNMASNKRKLPVTGNDPKSSKSDRSVAQIIGENLLLDAPTEELVKLAEHSTFFESILKNRSNQTIVITPPEAMDIDCLQWVLQGILDETDLRVDKSDIKEVLRVAQFLDSRRPVDWVENTLGYNLCQENAYEMWNAVADSGFRYLEDLAMKKLRFNFGYFAGTVEFQRCSVKELACIISGGPLEVESELHLLKTILSRCKGHRNTRWTAQSLSCLLQEIRWELIPVDFVETFVVIAEEPLPHIVTQLLDECLPPFPQSTDRHCRTLASAPNYNVPIPLRHSQEMAIFLCEMTFQCYRPPNNSIVSGRVHFTEPNQGVEHWMVYLDGKIWLYIGEGAMAVLDPCSWKLQRMPGADLFLSWQPALPPLVCCGVVFVLTEGRFIAYEEDFTVQRDLPLPHEAEMVTGWDQWGTDVYVCGEVQAESGQTPGEKDNTGTAEGFVHFISDRIYDPPQWEKRKPNRLCRFSTVTEQWTDCAPMDFVRRELSIIAHNGSIYATGGRLDMDVHSTTRTCERYDIASSTWHTIADLTFRRRRHCSFVINNRLYVAGGLSEYNTPITLMERYHEEWDQWEIVVLDAKYAQPVCPLACVVARTNEFA